MRMIFQKRKRLINNIRSYDTYFMKHLKNNLKDSWNPMNNTQLEKAL
mgnify:CR=1 FL=1